MDATAELIYGVTGQTVSVYPPEWGQGVPSSASARVYEGELGDDDTPEFVPSVSVDAVSTTVDAASGYSQANRRRLYVASTTGIAVGDDYRVENALGQHELIAVLYVATNDYLILDADLVYDYPATSSTVKGLKMSFAADATWLATEAKILEPGGPSYRVVWSYTLASVIRRRVTYARLVRTPGGTGVTVKDLRRRWPDLDYEEPSALRGQAYQWAIQAGYERVRTDLLAAGWQPSQPRDTELVDELVVRATLWTLARAGIGPGGRQVEAVIEECKKDYHAGVFQICKAGQRLDMDLGTQGAATGKPRAHIWFDR
jgi:hypothetical protein